MAYASCLNADLESADKIVCGSYFSCRGSEVTGAQTLYCTYHACDEAILRQVNDIYVLDKQSSMEIYSGGLTNGIANIFFWGDNSGKGASITCTQNYK